MIDRPSTGHGNGAGKSGNGRMGSGRRAFDELFDRFPYALLVVTRDGTLVEMNATCRKLLRDTQDTKSESHRDCCHLVCRRFADERGTCLTERAFANPELRPEIRVDLPSRANAGAAWVTVVANCPSESYGLFQLRPGQAGDRRRRSGDQSETGPSLRIFTLGHTNLEGSSGPIGGAWIEQRPGELLKYLASRRGRPASTEEIAEALWPGSDARSLGSVRYFVHILRSRLEPTRATRDSNVPSPIVSNRGGYSLDPERVWVDADEFESLVAAGLASLLARQHDTARDLLEKSVELYRGDLLADEPYAEWVLPERERLRELAARALRALVEIHIAAEDLERAEQPARRLAELEAYDSDAQRAYIELCLKQGRRTEAARRYELFRRRTLKAFGQSPEFRLSDLARSGNGEQSDPETQIRGGAD